MLLIGAAPVQVRTIKVGSDLVHLVMMMMMMMMMMIMMMMMMMPVLGYKGDYF